jgi:hypothetical protein
LEDAETFGVSEVARSCGAAHPAAACKPSNALANAACHSLASSSLSNASAAFESFITPCSVNRNSSFSS